VAAPKVVVMRPAMKKMVVVARMLDLGGKWVVDVRKRFCWRIVVKVDNVRSSFIPP
jgi:hypothetical protein